MDYRIKSAALGTPFFLVVLFLLLPIAGTALFSFAARWDRTTWPEGYTLSAYTAIFTSADFWASLYRSLFLSFIVIGIAASLVTETLLVVHLFLPHLKRFIEGLFLAPFVIPAVLFALGFVETYAPLPIPLYGTPLLLVFANVVLVFPLMYRAIENRMEILGIPKMVESALTLGARWPLILKKVVVPNLLSGITSGGLLALSMVLSEFALANLLVGGSWPTLPVYLYSVMRVDGQTASVISVMSFGITWFLSFLITRGGQRHHVLS